MAIRGVPSLVALVLVLEAALAMRMVGEYSPGSSGSSSSFFQVLAKFGFQKTNLLDKEDTQGFVFGNVSLVPSSSSSSDLLVDPVTLVVLERGYFLDMMLDSGGKRQEVNGGDGVDRDEMCAKIFRKIERVAYDAACYDDGEQDLIRTVPCRKDQLCPEEDNPANVVPGYQLTYRIQDLAQSRFWYVSLVACQRDKKTCKWYHVRDNYTIKYDLTLVNGNPASRNKNYFNYQFSCDSQDLLQVYLILVVIYTVMAPLQFSAALRQDHPITRLLTVALCLQFLAVVFTSIHFGVFALNGFGVAPMGYIGDVLEIFAQSLFMLLLLLLAMGWAITRQELTCKVCIISLWSLYAFVHCLLYIWKKIEVDMVDDQEEYQTVPGITILVLRVVVMLVFLVALRDTMSHEYTPERLSFFLHFGAASLVWFIYLPVVAVVALRISPLWRTKFLTAIINSADTFAYIVMVHLLWPSRSEQYFLLASHEDNFEELEELSQSANNLHMQRKNNNVYCDDEAVDSDDDDDDDGKDDGKSGF